MRGIITDIQHFSLHDGPGIRTTVFLKGCNMRCAWCHNPETLSPQIEIGFFKDLCIDCGQCVALCPCGAIMRTDHGIQIDRARIVDCMDAVAVCPTGALVQFGREMDADDVIADIEKDRAYYVQSGGGMTLSGGEPAMQAGFAKEILQGCHDRGIHTCMETNLSLPFERYEMLLPYCNLLIVDMKMADGERHDCYTGMSNEGIWANYESLAAFDVPVLVRTPVMAGINDNIEGLTYIAKRIAENPNLIGYELLPYHDIGLAKEAALGMELGNAFAAPSQVDLVRLQAMVDEEIGKKA